MDLSKKALAELLCQFLEVAINLTLYGRRVYPPELFERRRFLGAPVYFPRHPELREYVHSVVGSLKEYIENKSVERVVLRILDSKKGAILEQYVFQFCMGSSGGSSGSNWNLEALEPSLTGLLLRLSAELSNVPPVEEQEMPEGCTWELVSHFENLPPDFAQWVPADDDGLGPRSTVAPIKSLKSPPLNMTLYVIKAESSDVNHSFEFPRLP